MAWAMPFRLYYETIKIQGDGDKPNEILATWSQSSMFCRFRSVRNLSRIWKLVTLFGLQSDGISTSGIFLRKE